MPSRRISPQRATQLVAVQEVDEMCAPTDDTVNPLSVEGASSLASVVDFAEDVSCAIESTLGAELNLSQHVVADVSALRLSSDGDPGQLAKDLGVGAWQASSENLQSMGLPLRV